MIAANNLVSFLDHLGRKLIKFCQRILETKKSLFVSCRLNYWKSISTLCAPTTIRLVLLCRHFLINGNELTSLLLFIIQDSSQPIDFFIQVIDKFITKALLDESDSVRSLGCDSLASIAPKAMDNLPVRLFYSPYYLLLEPKLIRFFLNSSSQIAGYIV